MKLKKAVTLLMAAMMVTLTACGNGSSPSSTAKVEKLKGSGTVNKL